MVARPCVCLPLHLLAPVFASPLLIFSPLGLFALRSIHAFVSPLVLAPCPFDLVCVRSKSSLAQTCSVFAFVRQLRFRCVVLQGHWGTGAKNVSMKSSARFCCLSLCFIPGVPGHLHHRQQHRHHQHAYYAFVALHSAFGFGGVVYGCNL